jgi:predicted DNA binding CopG/RHH family protein
MTLPHKRRSDEADEVLLLDVKFCFLLPYRENDRSLDVPKKKIPELTTEAKERAFWAKEDSTAYVDWSKAKRATFPNLKPSTKTISIRLPESMLDELKCLANKRDVPYQSLVKMFLADRIEEEYKKRG